MLFSEVYGTYYNVLAKLLEKAVDGALTKESMNEIIRDNGFEESILTIPEALENQTWPLITDDFTTPLEHKPTMLAHCPLPITDSQSPIASSHR